MEIEIPTSIHANIKVCFTLTNMFVCFDLIIYEPVNFFSVMSGRVFQGWTSTKQRLKCLAQGHKAIPLVRLNSLTHAYTHKDQTYYASDALLFF